MMITEKIKTLVLLSMPVFAIHGTEEYLTGFYQTDSVSKWAFSIFEPMTSLQATFLLFQIGIGVLLATSYILLKGGRAVLYLATFLGLIFILEIHHVVKTISVMGYYPGIASALLIYILGFFYWKELIKNWRNNGRS